MCGYSGGTHERANTKTYERISAKINAEKNAKINTKINTKINAKINLEKNVKINVKIKIKIKAKLNTRLNVWKSLFTDEKNSGYSFQCRQTNQTRTIKIDIAELR